MPFDPNPGGTATHYDLVLIGKGYSIATYLLMADLSWAQRIAVLGGPDAWSKQLRGDGIVNHARFLVDPRFRERVRVNQETIDRATFLETNEAVFTAARDGLAANHPPAWTDATTRAVDPPAVEFGDRGLDGSGPFLVTAVTARMDTVAAAILRGQSIAAGGTVVPALNLPRNAELCVYDIDYKPYGDSGPDDLANPLRITAMRVVYGGGAGPHAVPDWARPLVGFSRNPPSVTYAPDGAVMDLDSFMRRFGKVGDEKELDGMTVAVVGGNAGVDAAVAALQQGASLHWLIRGVAGTKPFWLETKHYRGKDASPFAALKLAANESVINFQEGRRSNQLRVSAARDGVTIDLTQTLAPVRVRAGARAKAIRALEPEIFEPLPRSRQTFDAHIIVYAVGQDAGLTERIGNHVSRIGPGKVLAGEITASLVALFDRNERFGAPTGTLLGLTTRMAWDGKLFIGSRTQAADKLTRIERPGYRVYPTDRYRGLEVIGAAVGSLSREAMVVEEIDQLLAAALRRGLSNLAEAMCQKALVAPDQLGVLRSAIEASTGADFRNQVETMAGFLAAEANFAEAAALVLEDTDDAEEQKRRTTAFQQTAALLQQALLPAAREAYAEMYRERHGDLKRALRDRAPRDVEWFLHEMAMAEYWMGYAIFWTSWFLAGGTSYDNVQSAAEIPGRSLAAITPAIAWLQQHSPADYNGMDQTALAVLIATSYPHILPDAWEQITGKIIQQRSNASAWGYDQDQLQRISNWLAKVDALSKPLMDARQKKQPLPEEAVTNLADFLLANPEPYQYVG